MAMPNLRIEGSLSCVRSFFFDLVVAIGYGGKSKDTTTWIKNREVTRDEQWVRGG